MTGSGSAVFYAVKSGAEVRLISNLPIGWRQWAFRSLKFHPLYDWVLFKSAVRRGVAKWLRHRVLIPAREGSTPSSPAIFRTSFSSFIFAFFHSVDRAQSWSKWFQTA